MLITKACPPETTPQIDFSPSAKRTLPQKVFEILAKPMHE